MDPNAKQQIVERLKQANNILITVSENPTVDQLSAAIGTTLMFNKLDKHATAVFSGHVPSTIDFLQPEHTIEKNTDSLRDFIISLDKSKADKLRYKVEDNVVKIFITPYRTSLSDADLIFSQGDFNVDVVLALGVDQKEHIDQAIVAHGRILHDATVVSICAGSMTSDLGSVNWQDPNASSLCEMVMSISESFQSGIVDGQMATAFLTGIVAETERFRNEKTTPKVMTMSAQLMAAGANQQLIASNLEKVEEVALVEEVAPPQDQPEKVDDGSLKIEQEPFQPPTPPMAPDDQPLPEETPKTETDGRPMYDPVTGQVDSGPNSTPNDANEKIAEELGAAPEADQEPQISQENQQEASVDDSLDFALPTSEPTPPILPPVEDEPPVSSLPPAPEPQEAELPTPEPLPSAEPTPEPQPETVEPEPEPEVEEPQVQKKRSSPVHPQIDLSKDPDVSYGAVDAKPKQTDAADADEIAIDEQGLLHNLEEEAFIKSTTDAHHAQQKQEETSLATGDKPAYSTEPPSRDGTLTANTKPEVLSGSTDPLSQPTEKNPLLTHGTANTAPIVDSSTEPVAEPAATSTSNGEDTNNEDQKDDVLHSSLNADAARKAVLDAVNSVGFDEQRPEPIKALNAQPLDINPDQPGASQPSAPPLPPPIIPFHVGAPAGIPPQEAINPSSGGLILPNPSSDSDEEQSSLPPIV